MQITGRYNYEKQQEIINDLLKEETVSIINEDNALDEAFSMQQAVISGFSDWYHKKLYGIADKGASSKIAHEVVDKLNKGTKSRDVRVENFLKITSQVFDLSHCIELSDKKNDES